MNGLFRFVLSSAHVISVRGLFSVFVLQVVEVALISHAVVQPCLGELSLGSV